LESANARGIFNFNLNCTENALSRIKLRSSSRKNKNEKTNSVDLEEAKDEDDIVMNKPRVPTSNGTVFSNHF
jgi:hypothetical protein